MNKIWLNSVPPATLLSPVIVNATGDPESTVYVPELVIPSGSRATSVADVPGRDQKHSSGTVLNCNGEERMYH